VTGQGLRSELARPRHCDQKLSKITRSNHFLTLFSVYLLVKALLRLVGDCHLLRCAYYLLPSSALSDHVLRMDGRNGSMERLGWHLGIVWWRFWVVHDCLCQISFRAFSADYGGTRNEGLRRNGDLDWIYHSPGAARRWANPVNPYQNQSSLTVCLHLPLAPAAESRRGVPAPSTCHVSYNAHRSSSSICYTAVRCNNEHGPDH
jgi:hypothetical protein